MTPEETAHRFYRAFQSHDHATMRASYAKTAKFSDPAFPDLRGDAIGDMWEMLVSRAKELTLSYEVLSAKGERVVVAWEARYPFSKTGRWVTNKIRSEMVIVDGLIQDQNDSFNFHKWARQALGVPGLLLGWTGFLQRKVQATAADQLAKFQSKKGS
ncbi:MAG: nuclear transport factor 2 family protein [Polyangiaceae bacterium]|nr:nuclear transport factor 2 family protein [Polyangiaceae bacterium]